MELAHLLGEYWIHISRNNLEIRKNFFFNRVIDNWNELSVDIKESNTVKEFKNRLSKIKISDL